MAFGSFCKIKIGDLGWVDFVGILDSFLYRDRSHLGNAYWSYKTESCAMFSLYIIVAYKILLSGQGCFVRQAGLDMDLNDAYTCKAPSTLCIKPKRIVKTRTNTATQNVYH